MHIDKLRATCSSSFKEWIILINTGLNNNKKLSVKMLIFSVLFVLTGFIVGVCNCSMFCCMLPVLHVHSSSAIILMGKRELVALHNLSSWCLVMVEWLFLVVP